MPTVTLGDEDVQYSIRSRAGRITCHMTISAPGVLEPVPLRLEMDTRRRPWRPRVIVSAPDCRRHRYADGSLCMWLRADSASRRWVMSEGLTALAHYTQVHLYKEACCRAGEPWPGEQSPGNHPRPRTCRTCGGEGP